MINVSDFLTTSHPILVLQGPIRVKFSWEHTILISNHQLLLAIHKHNQTGLGGRSLKSEILQSPKSVNGFNSPIYNDQPAVDLSSVQLHHRSRVNVISFVWQGHAAARTSHRLGVRYMNLVHEPVHVPMAMSWSQWAQLSGCSQSKNSITLDCNYLLTVKKSKIIWNCCCVFRDIVKVCLASLVPIVPRFNHIRWQYGLIAAKSALSKFSKNVAVVHINWRLRCFQMGLPASAASQGYVTRSISFCSHCFWKISILVGFSADPSGKHSCVICWSLSLPARRGFFF